jgi:hypothetical protein
MRNRLIQMYLDIHGEEHNNSAWLETLTDDELEKLIVYAGQVGVMVTRSSSEYHTNVLATKLGAYRRSEVK